MKLFELQDVVREHVGRDKISEPQLKWCVDRGLREIEQRDNFYWMTAPAKIFNILEDQQKYSLADDLLITDFKEAELLLVSDRTADDPDWNEVVGPEPLHSTIVNFTETDDGKPAFWSLDEDNEDPSILLWPTLPDQDYRGKLVYYRWTALPTLSTSDAHEVLRRWPEALIYLACEQASLTVTKDIETAAYWRSLFVNINPVVNTEYKRIKLYDESRKSKQRFSSNPSSGSTTLTSKLRNKQKAWF